MKKEKLLKLGSAALALLAFFWFSYLSFFWDGQDGGSDNFMHYRIAKYSFSYPELFFNHWGKPVFTLLSSAFAQIGFEGIEFFNTLVSIATFFTLIKITKYYHLKNSLSLFIFLFCAPAYYYMIPTSMTEVLFGFWLSFSIWLAVQKKHFASALFLGFIIWIRSEGFVVFLPFIVFYLLEKKWKAPFGLAIGWFVISLLGLPFKKSLLWFFSEMPYGDATQIYGQGSIFHFINEYAVIWGPAIGIAFIVGAAVIIVNWIKNGILKRSKWASILLLAIGPSMAYLAAHSYSWYSGSGGSLGLTRVMASIVPAMALVSVFGISQIHLVLNKSKIWSIIPSGILMIWALVFWITSTHIFFPENEMNNAVKRAATSFQKHHFKDQKVNYMIPSLVHYLGIDPYNSEKAHQYFDAKGLEEMKVGEILVWDAHHSPSEGKLTLASVMQNHEFKLIDVYKPEFDFTVYNNKLFEIYFFEKVAAQEMFNNDSLKVQILNDKYEHLKRVKLLEIKDSFQVNDEKPYSQSFELITNEVAIDADFKVEIELEILVSSVDQLANTHVVLTQVEDGDVKFYGSISLNSFEHLKTNESWQKVKGLLYPNMKFKSALLKGYVYTTNAAVSNIRNVNFIALELH